MFRAVSANHIVTQSWGAVRSLSTTGASTRTRSKFAVVLGQNSSQYNILASVRSCYAAPALANRQLLQPRSQVSRMFSSDASKNNNNNKQGGPEKEGGGDAKDGSEETQIVLTPGQKMVAYSRLSMWAGIFAFASVCAYYIGRELFPT